MLPLSRTDLMHLLKEACSAVATLPTFSHHLAKASVERWFAFELAAKLDDLLMPHGWVALVECGGHGKLGNFDLLLVPEEQVRGHDRVRADFAAWAPETIAVELKASHLADGEAPPTDALVDDLTKKPVLAKGAGRECAMLLGVLVTTSGLGKHASARLRQATDARVSRMRAATAVAGFALVRAIERTVVYGEWSGLAWVDLVEASGAGGTA